MNNNLALQVREAFSQFLNESNSKGLEYFEFKKSKIIIEIT